MATKKNHLLVGTRKGLAVYKRKNNNWIYDRMDFIGIPVTIVYVDSRSNTWWACLDHGHWGVKLHRSKDEGTNWEEIPAPKFPEGAEIKEGVLATNKYIWALTSGGNEKSKELLMGTIPGGLFHSQDDGDTFELVDSLWQHPSRIEHWFGAGFDHPGIHSIVVDPRDNNHFYVGISCAGVFETTDAGKTWTVRNKGLRADFLPDKNAEVGHDPHLLVGSPKNPDVLWQQNHCGIYKSLDGGKEWIDVSRQGEEAYFGFTIAIDENDPDCAYVVPCDSDETRVALNGALCICRTDDGGKTWQTFRNGLPQEGCFDIVYRHGLTLTGNELAFGTTCGNLFYSNDKGENWNCLNSFLPMVYSITFAS